MNHIDTMKLALEALEVATTPLAKDRQEVLRAITAIREALADHIGDANKMVEQSTCKQALQVEQPAQQQEPFCYHDGRDIVGKEYADHSDVFPLYTAPKPRQWVGLTQQDMKLALEWDKRRKYIMPYVVRDALREALAEQPAQGCDHCNHALYAGTKCKNCGRVTEQAAIKRDLTPEQPAQQEPVALEEYDAGLLNDFGGGNVEWWQDYIRAELGRAYEHYQSQMAAPQPAQRKPLTDEQITLFINGRGDEGDDDYVEPTGDGFGLTDADLVKLVRRVEAHYGIKENT